MIFNTGLFGGISRPSATIVSAAVAVKLSEAFPNTTPELWLRLQNQYDIAKVLRQRRKKIPPLRKPAKMKMAA